MNDDTRLIAAECVCVPALRLCEGCDDARCFSCIPYGTNDCDANYYPPSAEEVPA